MSRKTCREQDHCLVSGSYPASRELERENKAEADIVVPILWIVVIPIDRAAILGMVEVAAATENAVLTFVTMNLAN